MGRGILLKMHGPASIAPGERIRYDLEVLGDNQEVQRVELVARASRGIHVTGAGGRTQNFQSMLGSIVHTVAGASYPIELALPQQFPPSHTLLSMAWSRVWIDVRVWSRKRLAAEQHFPIHVRAPLDARGPEPAIAREKQQNMELALGLGSKRAAPGTTLVGQCSAIGAEVDIDITLDVLCRLRTFDGLKQVIPIRSSKLKLPVRTAAAGVPFTLPLPSYLPPSLAIDTHSIEYVLRASHKRWFRTTIVTIPLHIVDAQPAPAKIRPPAVGERQVEPVFAAVAEKEGWRIGPSVDAHPELGTIMPWLYAAHLGVVMRLGYAFRENGETFLVSRIRYRPLELGLRVGPRPTFRGALGEGLHAGLPEWDREYIAEAKDTARARELLTNVVPELGPLGGLVRWDDDWLICEREVTDVTAELLEEIAVALRTVARKVAHALRSDGPEVGPYR